jgi:hypothetical protein
MPQSDQAWIALLPLHHEVVLGPAKGSQGPQLGKLA